MDGHMEELGNEVRGRDGLSERIYMDVRSD